MKIILKFDAPEWHLLWMIEQTGWYARDRQITNIEIIDPNDRSRAIDFVQYLREKGYDAWRHMDLYGDSYIYVQVTAEVYMFEQLRLQE